MGIRLTLRAKNPESGSPVVDDTGPLVIELPVDEMTAVEPATDDLHGESRRGRGRLARTGRAVMRPVRRLNPARATKTALGASGRAARSVVVTLEPQRLARAVRAFRRIGPVDPAVLASGIGRGSRNVAGRLRLMSPRRARSVRVVAAAVRRLVRNIEPAAAARMAREATRSAQESIARLDPRAVEKAVRRFVKAVDSDDGGKRVGSSEGRWINRVARAAVARTGPARTARIAGEAAKVLFLLVRGLDPDRVADFIRQLVFCIISPCAVNGGVVSFPW